MLSVSQIRRVGHGPTCQISSSMWGAGSVQHRSNKNFSLDSPTHLQHRTSHPHLGLDPRTTTAKSSTLRTHPLLHSPHRNVKGWSPGNSRRRTHPAQLAHHGSKNTDPNGSRQFGPDRGTNKHPAVASIRVPALARRPSCYMTRSGASHALGWLETPGILGSAEARRCRSQPTSGWQLSQQHHPPLPRTNRSLPSS